MRALLAREPHARRNIHHTTKVCLEQSRRQPSLIRFHTFSLDFHIFVRDNWTGVRESRLKGVMAWIVDRLVSCKLFWLIKG